MSTGPGSGTPTSSSGPSGRPAVGSVTSLVWAVLDRASTGWRGFTMTAAGLRLLRDLRRTLLEPPAELRSRGEPPAADQHSDEQTAQEEVRSA